MRAALAALLRNVLPLAALLAVPAARAEVAIERNEPLAMRLIFDDCLAFARDGKPPFEGLKRGPVPRDVLDGLSRPADFVGPNAQTTYVVSRRYVAIWGIDPWRRAFCTVQTPFGAEEPGRLGIDPRTFLARVVDRAKAEGLTEIYGAEAGLSPLKLLSFSEPGEKEGELSFTFMPRIRNADGTLVDIGLIMMGGRVR